jgi:hypothetical protein
MDMIHLKMEPSPRRWFHCPAASFLVSLIQSIPSAPSLLDSQKTVAGQFVPLSRVERTVLGPEGPVPDARVELQRRRQVQALNSTAVWSSGPAGKFISSSLGERRRRVFQGGGRVLGVRGCVTVRFSPAHQHSLQLNQRLAVSQLPRPSLISNHDFGWVHGVG